MVPLFTSFPPRKATNDPLRRDAVRRRDAAGPAREDACAPRGRPVHAERRHTWSADVASAGPAASRRRTASRRKGSPRSWPRPSSCSACSDTARRGKSTSCSSHPPPTSGKTASPRFTTPSEVSPIPPESIAICPKASGREKAFYAECVRAVAGWWFGRGQRHCGEVSHVADVASDVADMTGDVAVVASDVAGRDRPHRGRDRPHRGRGQPRCGRRQRHRGRGR